MHGKVAHAFVYKKSVKLLWRDDPCHVKEQLLMSEELHILLSKNCAINYLLLILCRKGVKPMTFWSQLGSDPLPLSFWKLPQNAMQVTKVLIVNLGQPQRMITTVLRKTYNIGLQLL